MAGSEGGLRRCWQGSARAGGAGERPGHPDGGCTAVAWRMLRHGTVCAAAVLHRGSDPGAGTYAASDF